ncbi:MAG: hypothetical protein U0168_03155 [Nannocystaceae bacterium]
MTLVSLALALVAPTAFGAPKATQQAQPAEPHAPVSPAPSDNAKVARRAVRDAAAAFFVCLHAADPQRPSWCLSLASLQRRALADRERIDAAVAKAAAAWGRARPEPLTDADVDGRLAGVELGCTGPAGGHGAITLESEDLTGALGAGDAGARARCASSEASSLGPNLDALAVDASEAWDMTADYLDAFVACGRARQQQQPASKDRNTVADCALAQGCTDDGDVLGHVTNHDRDKGWLEPAVGRLWSRIVDALGGSEHESPGNAVTGGRGYCLAEGPCGEGSCEQQASAKSLKQRLRQLPDEGCNDQATPNPEGGSGCVTAKPAKSWTAADAQAAFTRICALRQRVATPVDGRPMRCVLPKPKTKPAVDACHDDVGMCAPEQGGAAVPGSNPQPPAPPQ